MANLYHVTSRICDSPPKEPSILGSGLGENTFSVSLDHGTAANAASETPTVVATEESVAVSVGSPGPEPNQEEGKRPVVLVVGAGISGLRAASVLQRHGIQVVVLEGRDRIGGRIHTTRTEKGVRDIGAAWMHETSQNKLVKLISKLSIDYYYDDGSPVFYTEFGRSGAQFKAKKVADEFADHVAWFYENHPDAPDRPVSEFMHDFIRDHELISNDERAWAPQALKEVELWLGTNVESASSKHLSYFITERNLYMKGGYDGIVQWTAGSLIDQDDTIRLNHLVTKIAWSEDGSSACYVECKDKDGKLLTIEGDAVISTLPLGVLRHRLVPFDPPLPPEYELGISNFSYGALGKVFFEFTEVFWPKDNDQFIFYPTPDEESPYSSSPSSSSSSTSAPLDTILAHATVTINLWIMTGSRELCVQVAEPLTQRIEAMAAASSPSGGDHHHRAIYKFFEPLFKLLRTEPYKALPSLVSVETTRWTQDPLAGFGSYSAEKVGDEPGVWMEALERNKGSRLQFAGEHCTMVANGCVHGAFATGETAAKNLLEGFGVGYDGGDLVSIQ